VKAPEEPRPPRPQRPPGLPADLEALGARLEGAARRRVARRVAIRRSALHGALVVLVGTPLALAAAARDVAPSSRPVDRLARLAPPDAVIDASSFHAMDQLPRAALVASNVRSAPELPSPVPSRNRKLY